MPRARGFPKKVNLYADSGLDTDYIGNSPLPDDPDQRPLAQYQNWDPYITDVATKLFSMLRVDDPDFALAHDIASIEKIRRDAVVQQLCAYRRHLVAGRDWHLDPGDDSPQAKELASVIEWLIRKSKNFTAARFRLSDAIFLGLTSEKMVMKVDYLTIPSSVSPSLGGVMTQFMFVDKFMDIDKRRLRLEYRDYGKYNRDYYWTIFNIHRREWRRLTNADNYIFHTYNNEEDTYGYGRGLNEAIFYYWRGKMFLLKYAQQFCEAFAKPWIRAKLAELKGRGEELQTRMRKWVSILEKMRGNNVVIGGTEDEFDFMSGPTAGQQVLMELLRYFDEALTRLIVGSQLAVREGQPGLGSGQEAEVHQSTTEIYVNYDRQILQEALARSLVKSIFEGNYSIFEAAGLADCELPKFMIDNKTKENPLEILQQVQIGQQIGMQFDAEQVYERTGWKMPAEGAQILQPMMMGMGGEDENLEDTGEPKSKSKKKDKGDKLEAARKKLVKLFNTNDLRDYMRLHNAA